MKNFRFSNDSIALANVSSGTERFLYFAFISSNTVWEMDALLNDAKKVRHTLGMFFVMYSRHCHLVTFVSYLQIVEE